MEEDEHLLISPFEKNLEVWRQLWRVVERSDVLVQIVDARNPLLFRSLDLEKYVKEVDAHKRNVLLVNKADLLTTGQRYLQTMCLLLNSPPVEPKRIHAPKAEVGRILHCNRC
jgi:ribosome biogenesis GTPase A